MSNSNVIEFDYYEKDTQSSDGQEADPQGLFSSNPPAKSMTHILP